MKRPILLIALLCFAGGCLRPLTQRMDLVNQQLTDANAKLVEATRKLDETNQKLATMERATRLLVPGLDKKE